jgi:hypothetical protein
VSYAHCIEVPGLLLWVGLAATSACSHLLGHLVGDRVGLGVMVGCCLDMAVSRHLSFYDPVPRSNSLSLRVGDLIVERDVLSGPGIWHIAFTASPLDQV